MAAPLRLSRSLQIRKQMLATGLCVFCVLKATTGKKQYISKAVETLFIHNPRDREPGTRLIPERDIRHEGWADAPSCECLAVFRCY